MSFQNLMRLKRLSTRGARRYHLEMAYQITDACTRCSACLAECPTDSIIEGQVTYQIDADTCQNDASCTLVCPVDAIVKVTPGALTTGAP